jgi:hypothetical protein
LAVILVAGALFIANEACAQGRLEAKYDGTLAGLTIGKGAWIVDIAEDQYSLQLSGSSAGLMKAVGGGQGSGVTQGRITSGQFVPVSYVSSVVYGKKNETIRMALAAGNVKSSSIEPEPPPNPDRIPVRDADWHGVFDPMTGSLLHVAGTGDPVVPAACSNTASIFDGRMRYDLHLSYKRMETVKAQRGYQGPAVVCAVTFNPISGYVQDRAAIKYVTAQRDMEIWFAPIAGTRMLAPFKIVIPTPIGMGLIEASEFVTMAVPKPAKIN